MYADRISSSIETRRTASIRSESIGPSLTPASVSRLSLASFASTRDGHLDRHPVPGLELCLRGRAGSQEFAVRFRDEAAIIAADLAADLIDAPPSLRHPSAGGEGLAGVGRRTVSNGHLGGDRPRVEARRRPRHHLVEQGCEQAPMYLLLPADEVRAGDPRRAGCALAELDRQVHADRVRASTSAAVVVGERVSSTVTGLDQPAGPESRWLAARGAHQRSSSSSSQSAPNSSVRAGRGAGGGPGRGRRAVCGEGQGEGVADGVPVAQEVDRLAALPNPVRLEQGAPVLQLPPGLPLDLADIGYVSAWHRSRIGSVLEVQVADL